ncbi:response regulator transcription factor [Hymenobacter cellulosilyticus]|uniref:Response regulator transcription factor n=1 Tax=Hymenobacter cellulosilyticus TaxID=2932248 RepID=A0A8T9QBP4_9BACT|nr:response regulator transcription factor [Hymenobacter cellulosilyticus]UOQ72283.1 response regulator transcription factor [Hymenobacter cellulosilyticus]
MNILLVEDDLMAAALLKRGLEQHNLTVAVALNAPSAQQMLATTIYTAVLLKADLPESSGFELCRYIRQHHDKLSVLMFTDNPTTEYKLQGFEAGTDDYLVTPFEFGELLARLRALHRRYPAAAPPENVLKVADLELYGRSRIVKRGDKRIDLTGRELALLEYFMHNQGRAVTRQEIVQKVWDLAFDTGTNVVDVYVNYLRKKVDKNFSPKLIHTLNGIGYILEERTA